MAAERGELCLWLMAEVAVSMSAATSESWAAACGYVCPCIWAVGAYVARWRSENNLRRWSPGSCHHWFEMRNLFALELYHTGQASQAVS